MDEFPLVFNQLLKLAKKRKELCLQSLIQSSYIIEQIELGPKDQCVSAVDKTLLNYQFTSEMGKVEREIRRRETMARTMREELFSLAVEVEKLRRGVKVRVTQLAGQVWRQLPNRLPRRAPRPR